MNLRPRKRRSPEVTLTPLIDIVFLLLIFFMVSTTFDHQSQIRIELPQAGTEEEPDTPEEMLDITIDRSGRFYVNQREVINTELSTLKRAIEKAIADKTNLPVTISADAQTPHQAVMTAMDAASQLGLVQMTFAARQPQE